MFGSIGVFEMVLVAGVALMVLGPEKFPEFAKLSMRTMRDIRKYVSDAQRDISNELNPIKKEIGDIRRVDVEDYVGKLVNDEDEDDDSKPYNPEPDPSVIDDWYPEEGEELVAGADETGGEDAAYGSDEDSAQEYTGGTVPYEDTTAGDNIGSGYIEEPEGEVSGREEEPTTENAASEEPDEPEKLDG